MSRNIAVRLTCSYELLASTLGDWSCVSKYLVCYEHPEPDNIHCHLLLTGVYCTDQHLKDVMWEHNVPCKGSGQLSFKTTFKNPENKKEIFAIDETNWERYISYMSKGKYDPKYNKGFSDETIQSCKSAWIDYTTQPKPYLNYLAFAKQFNSVTKPVSVADVKVAAHIYAIKRHKSHTKAMRFEVSQLIDDYCYYHNITKKYLIPFQDDK